MSERRKERRRLLRLVKKGKITPEEVTAQQGEVRGEVQFNVRIRDGMIIIDVHTPNGDAFGFGVNPDGAEQLANTLFSAAEAVRRGQKDSS